MAEAEGIETSPGWLRVPPVPDSLVVNVGDYLSLLSGGRFISPRHRVTMPPSGKSCPLWFLAPNSRRTNHGVSPELRTETYCANLTGEKSRSSLVFFAYPEYGSRLSLAQPDDAMRTSLFQQQQVRRRDQT